MPNFTTGPSTLPDVGTLFYNGVTFSPLFETNVSGDVVRDAAGRTTTRMNYTITADGYVTLPDEADDIGGPMLTLRRLLTAQAGALVYKGRGNDIIVNAVGSPVRDVAWGPIPKILEFQPLGGGRSAKIRWQVTTSIVEIAPKVAIGGAPGPVLQFNEETAVTYDEAGYSTLSIRGTLEIPLTRIIQSRRTSTQTVDDFRQTFMQQVATSIDLTRFRVTRREFNISRDKRTLEWSFAAEEQPWMANPPNIPVARGTYDVKPAKQGLGMVTWNCTLRCTYTVPKPTPKRWAWVAFLAMLRWRMSQSANAQALPNPGNGGAAAAGNQNYLATVLLSSNLPGLGYLAWNYLTNTPAQAGAAQQAAVMRHANVNVARTRNAWLLDFNFTEGLYQDSKTVTFSATWRLVTTFSEILLASGLWTRVPGQTSNLWAASMQNLSSAGNVGNIMGWRSWLANRLDARQDVIVDFGG